MEGKQLPEVNSEDQKKTYEAPVLTELGGVEDITKTGTGISVDFNW